VHALRGITVLFGARGGTETTLFLRQRSQTLLWTRNCELGGWECAVRPYHVKYDTDDNLWAGVPYRRFRSEQNN